MSKGSGRSADASRPATELPAVTQLSEDWPATEATSGAVVGTFAAA